jgi:hypothetical protein
VRRRLPRSAATGIKPLNGVGARSRGVMLRTRTRGSAYRGRRGGEAGRRSAPPGRAAGRPFRHPTAKGRTGLAGAFQDAPPHGFGQSAVVGADRSLVLPRTHSPAFLPSAVACRHQDDERAGRNSTSQSRLFTPRCTRLSAPATMRGAPGSRPARRPRSRSDRHGGAASWTPPAPRSRHSRAAPPAAWTSRRRSGRRRWWLP